MKKSVSHFSISNRPLGFSSINFLLIGIIFPFLLSCDNTLSRSEAENKLKSQLPKLETQEFKIYGKGYEYGSMLGRGGEVQLHKNLAKLGVVDLIERHGDMAAYFPGVQSIKLTKKGKQYVLNQTSDRYEHINLTCRVSDLEFVGVTGISQQKGTNVANVKYTQTRKVTPFGTAVNLNDGLFESSIIFTKYDDGWRIGQ